MEDFVGFIKVSLASIEILKPNIHSHKNIKACVSGISLYFGETAFLFNGETSTGGVLLKKVFLTISQNSQKGACARVFFW